MLFLISNIKYINIYPANTYFILIKNVKVIIQIEVLFICIFFNFTFSTVLTQCLFTVTLKKHCYIEYLYMYFPALLCYHVHILRF